MEPIADDIKTQILQRPSPTKRIPGRYQASVVILKGYAEGMEYPIKKTYAVIGRSKDAAVPLKDPMVSREHAAIVFHEDAFILKVDEEGTRAVDADEESRMAQDPGVPENDATQRLVSKLKSVHHAKSELPEDDRCAFYLKDKKVEIEDGVDVNPLDTEQFDYDDIKRIFGEEIINNSGTS